MNWIDMTDQEKLIHYAKTFPPTDFRVFTCDNNAGSYFFEYQGNNANNCDIIEYNIEHYDHFKKSLTDMWSKTGFNNPDLLTTIVAAVTMKNMPQYSESDLSHKNTSNIAIIKEATERVSMNDSPPVFVYEF